MYYMDDNSEFIEDFLEKSKEKSYPNINKNFAYDILRSIFIKAELNDQEKVEKLEGAIEKFMQPLENYKNVDESEFSNIKNEYVSLAISAKLFNESLQSFTQRDGEDIHGYDIAKRFVKCDNYKKAKQILEEFESWFDKDLERLNAESEVENIKSVNNIDKNELLFNGLRMMIDLRDKLSEEDFKHL